MTFINSLIERIENIHLSPASWFYTFLSIVFIRIFLENISSRTPDSIFTQDMSVVVHYTLFFLVTLLIFTLLLHFFSKKKLLSVSTLTLFFLPIIWVAPIVDLIVSKGQGSPMSYLFKSNEALLYDFLHFFGPLEAVGVTLGLRVEIVLILLSAFAFVFVSTKKPLVSGLAVFFIYTSGFLMASLPSFIGLEVKDLLIKSQDLIGGSFFEAHYLNSVTQFSTIHSIYESYFHKVISLILFLLLITLTILFALRSYSSKMFIILCNSRHERVIHYISLLFLGIYFATQTGTNIGIFSNWLNIIGVITLTFVVYFIWMFSVCINDIFDISADKLSNTTRPLVTGSLSVTEMKYLAAFFLILSLVGSYIISPSSFFITITIAALSTIYSMPPFRLKRFVLLNSFIISLASLSVVFLGFLLVNSDQKISSFPLEWGLLLAVSLTLLANIKDIKDIEGDRADGVFTIPVLFGDKQGRHIIGALVAITLSLVPLFTSLQILWIPAIMFSVISWHLIHIDPFNDKYLFYLYFAFIIVDILLVQFV